MALESTTSAPPAEAQGKSQWLQRLLTLDRQQVMEGGAKLARALAENLSGVAAWKARGEAKEMSNFMQEHEQLAFNLVERRQEMLAVSEHVKGVNGKWGEGETARIESPERIAMLQTLSQLRTVIDSLPKAEAAKQRKVLAQILWANRTRHAEAREGIQQSMAQEDWNQRLNVAEKATTPIILGLGLATGGLGAGAATAVRAAIDSLKRANEVLTERHRQHAREEAERIEVTWNTVFVQGFLKWKKAVQSGDIQAITKGLGYAIGSAFMTDSAAFDGAGRQTLISAVKEAPGATWSALTDAVAPSAAAAEEAPLTAADLLAIGTGDESGEAVIEPVEAVEVAKTSNERLTELFETKVNSRDLDAIRLELQPLFGEADLKVFTEGSDTLKYLSAENITSETVKNLIAGLDLDLENDTQLNLVVIEGGFDNGVVIDGFSYTLERADGIKIAPESSLLTKLTPGGIPLSEYAVVSINVNDTGEITSLLLDDGAGNAESITSLDQLSEPVAEKPLLASDLLKITGAQGAVTDAVVDGGETAPEALPAESSGAVSIETSKDILVDLMRVADFVTVGEEAVRARLTEAGFSEGATLSVGIEAIHLTNLNEADMDRISQLIPVQGTFAQFTVYGAASDYAGDLLVNGSGLQISDELIPAGAGDWSLHSIGDVGFSSTNEVSYVRSDQGILYKDGSLTEAGKVGAENIATEAGVANAADESFSRRFPDREVYDIVRGQSTDLATTQNNPLEGISVAAGMEAKATDLIESGFAGFDRIIGEPNNFTIIYDGVKILPVLDLVGVESGAIEQISFAGDRPSVVYGIGLRIDPDLIPDTVDANMLRGDNVNIAGIQFAPDGSLVKVTAVIDGNRFDNILTDSSPVQRVVGVSGGSEYAPDRAPVAAERPVAAAAPVSATEAAATTTAPAVTGEPKPLDVAVNKNPEEFKFTMPKGCNFTEAVDMVLKKLAETDDPAWIDVPREIRVAAIESFRDTPELLGVNNIDLVHEGKEYDLGPIIGKISELQFAAENSSGAPETTVTEVAPVINDAEIAPVAQSGDNVTKLFQKYIDANMPGITEAQRDAAIAAVGANTEAMQRMNVNITNINIIPQEAINLTPLVEALENSPATTTEPTYSAANAGGVEAVDQTAAEVSISRIIERIRDGYESNLTQFMPDPNATGRELLYRLPDNATDTASIERWFTAITEREMVLASFANTDPNLTTEKLARIEIVGLSDGGIELVGTKMDALSDGVREGIETMLADLKADTDDSFVKTDGTMNLGMYLESKSAQETLKLGYDTSAQKMTYTK